MELGFSQYQKLAERTANRTAEDADFKRYTNFSMGLAGETGEVVDYLKKVVYHGHELNADKLSEELGDILWYIATIATTAGLDLQNIAFNNIEKLKKRYPNGFSTERSINRDS